MADHTCPTCGQFVAAWWAEAIEQRLHVEEQQKGAFSLQEAAGYLSVGETTLRELIREGAIPVSKIRGRSVIRRETLDQFLRSVESPGGLPWHPNAAGEDRSIPRKTAGRRLVR